MVSKISLPGLLSTSVLTGTVLLATMTPSSACPFSQKSGLLKGTESSSPSTPTNSAVSFNQPDMYKLGIAGLAAILGLGGGGMILKAKLAKRDQILADRSEIERTVEYPVFPIEVPAEALRSVDDAEAAEAQSGTIR